jgi:hypothetical protein
VDVSGKSGEVRATASCVLGGLAQGVEVAVESCGLIFRCRAGAGAGAAGIDGAAGGVGIAPAADNGATCDCTPGESPYSTGQVFCGAGLSAAATGNLPIVEALARLLPRASPQRTPPLLVGSFEFRAPGLAFLRDHLDEVTVRDTVPLVASRLLTRCDLLIDHRFLFKPVLKIGDALF